MPRNVRNFWIELEVDGKKQKIATGPTSKDGGFRLRILQRHRGEITTPLSVEGLTHPCGDIRLYVNTSRLDMDGKYITQR